MSASATQGGHNKREIHEGIVVVRDESLSSAVRQQLVQ